MPDLGSTAKKLGDLNPKIREDAAWELGEYRWLAVPYLARALGDENADVRCTAASTLAEIGAEAVAAIDRLISTLDDPAEKVRIEAAVALGAIGADAESAVPALCNSLDDPGVALCAAEALGRIGEAGIPGLLQAITHPTPSVRGAAVHSLGRIGPAARVAIPPLVDTLTADHSHLRIEAARALIRIAPRDEKVAVSLVARLSDRDEEVRRTAAAVLADTDPAFAFVRDGLEGARRDSAESVGQTASESLHRLGHHEEAGETRETRETRETEAMFHSVARVDELSPGSVKTVRIGDVDIALFSASGRVYALVDRCPHANAKLSEGMVDGSTVTCPRHWARFELRTGRALSAPATSPAQTLEVKFAHGEILVADPSSRSDDQGPMPTA